MCLGRTELGSTGSGTSNAGIKQSVVSAAFLPRARGTRAVGPGKIREGIDVRTTVMLRKLSKNLDRHALTALLDITSYGEYDFLRWRIDFSNTSYVGLSFADFTDPIRIVEFMQSSVCRRCIHTGLSTPGLVSSET